MSLFSCFKNRFGISKREGSRDAQQNTREKKDKDIAKKLAQEILKVQFKLATYLNNCVVGKPVRQIRILLLCFVIAVGSYCTYLIWEAVAAFF